MMKIWLTRIGKEVAAKREARNESQEDFADRIGLSRQQISVMENGKRRYGIEPLLEILAGLDADPVVSLLAALRNSNTLDAETITACRLLVEALSGGRRDLALALVRAVTLSPGHGTDRKEN